MRKRIRVAFVILALAQPAVAGEVNMPPAPPLPPTCTENCTSSTATTTTTDTILLMLIQTALTVVSRG